MVGTSGIRQFLEDASDSAWGPAVFFLAYVVLVVAMLPGTVGTLTAGAVFGFSVGFPLALGAATVGATIAFFVSRLLGRDGVEQLLGDRLDSIDSWIGKNDFMSIVVLRLMPIVPFNLLNYASGLSRVRPSRYIAGTVLGMIPGTAAVTTTAAMAADGTPTEFAFAAVGLLVIVLVTTYAGRRYVAKQQAQAAADQ